jgi:ABC-type Fe3+-siderophore transport system permease subunit
LKILVKILSYIVFIGLFFGIFSKELLGDRLGDVIIGVSVLVGTFIFMPLFLAHRWKGKKLKDYTLSDENLKKMKENSGKY